MKCFRSTHSCDDFFSPCVLSHFIIYECWKTFLQFNLRPVFISSFLDIKSGQQNFNHRQSFRPKRNETWICNFTANPFPCVDAGSLFRVKTRIVRRKNYGNYISMMIFNQSNYDAAGTVCYLLLAFNFIAYENRFFVGVKNSATGLNSG